MVDDLIAYKFFLIMGNKQKHKRHSKTISLQSHQADPTNPIAAILERIFTPRVYRSRSMKEDMGDNTSNLHSRPQQILQKPWAGVSSSFVISDYCLRVQEMVII